MTARPHKAVLLSSTFFGVLLHVLPRGTPDCSSSLSWQGRPREEVGGGLCSDSTLMRRIVRSVGVVRRRAGLQGPTQGMLAEISGAPPLRLRRGLHVGQRRVQCDGTFNAAQRHPPQPSCVRCPHKMLLRHDQPQECGSARAWPATMQPGGGGWIRLTPALRSHARGWMCPGPAVCSTPGQSGPPSRCSKCSARDLQRWTAASSVPLGTEQMQPVLLHMTPGALACIMSVRTAVCGMFTSFWQVLVA